METLTRKEKDKLYKMNEIITAAEKVFFEKGFEAAKMDDIAKKAQFTKKTIYSYFSSKEEIYCGIMLRGFNILNKMFADIINSNPDKSEEYKIQALGNEMINFYKNYPGYFKAIGDYENKDFDFDPDNKSLIIHDCYMSGQKCLSFLMQCISNGIKKGEFISSSDPVTICILLWSCIQGFINLLSKKQVYIKNYYNKDTLDLLEDGFKILIRSIKN